MDQAVIDYALKMGLIENMEELATITESEIDILEAAYEDSPYLEGLAKHLCSPYFELENGERTPGKDFWAYVHENHEQAIRRELSETGINTDSMTYDEAYDVYVENYDAIMEKYNETKESESPVSPPPLAAPESPKSSTPGHYGEDGNL